MKCVIGLNWKCFLHWQLPTLRWVLCSHFVLREVTNRSYYSYVLRYGWSIGTCWLAESQSRTIADIQIPFMSPLYFCFTPSRCPIGEYNQLLQTDWLTWGGEPSIRKATSRLHEDSDYTCPYWWKMYNWDCTFLTLSPRRGDGMDRPWVRPSFQPWCPHDWIPSTPATPITFHGH